MRLLGEGFSDVNFLRNIIKPGWHCIDIGANLGYVTVPISNLCGGNGNVIAIEPVKIFNELLEKHISKYSSGNVKIYKYALGKEEKVIEMGMPIIDGILRHGFTKVVESSSKYPYGETYNVEMKNPKTLFKDIKKLDFLKCDVEGYEINIIPEMIEIIKKFKPIILIEFSVYENRKTLGELFKDAGYELFRIENQNLKPVTLEEMLSLTLNSYILKPA